MSDLVGTCPKSFWEEWLAEGDCAGTPPTGRLYSWNTNHRLAAQIQPGDRFYVVAHGRLRGYASVLWVDDFDRDVSVRAPTGFRYGIVRGGGAVAVTIPQPILGFRGLRLRWWDREEEVPFPAWHEA